MIINKVLDLMISYNGTDVRRINHVLKVYCFSGFIAEKENLDSQTIDTIKYAAILHDIGIHKAEEIYHSSAGRYQEELGPGVAKELIDNLEIDAAIKTRVYYLIGNHHSYEKIDGIDFQILVEADFLVNIFEDAMDQKSIVSIRDKIFKTKTGIDLLETMYIR
jgi:CRISPR/Cas system-associated endonuclease Cas3-HD